MRIAYMTSQPMDRDDGVADKIADQARIWRRLGCEVRLHVLSGRPSILPDIADVALEWTPSGNLVQRNRRATKWVERVSDWNPDVVFFRMGAYYPALGPLMRRIPTVVDLNTNDLLEMRRVLPPWLWFYYRHFRARLLSLARGVTTVTDELARSVQLRRAGLVGRLARVVPNGIELSRFETLPTPSTETPHLFFLGSAGRIWHGTDKIVELARLRPGWSFEIVGPSSTDFREPPPSNVRVRGPLSSERYVPIMRHCHVAIGSLAMHRNGMTEGCPLKVREYLARGLPVITGYRDVDFSDDCPFVLRLPAADDNVRSHLSAIDRFVERWRGERVVREAVRHLDLALKERSRLSFLREIVEGKPSGTSSLQACRTPLQPSSCIRCVGPPGLGEVAGWSPEPYGSG